MASSIREQLIKGMVDDISTLRSIKTVTRMQPSDEAALERYAATQLPLVAVTGGVPIPVEHRKSRHPGAVDVFLSKLSITLSVYFLGGKNPDSKLSELLNDLWVKIYSDQTRSNLAIDTVLSPQVDTLEIDPYIAFMIVVEITYKHDTGGI